MEPATGNIIAAVIAGSVAIGVAIYNKNKREPEPVTLETATKGPLPPELEQAQDFMTFLTRIQNSAQVASWVKVSEAKDSRTELTALIEPMKEQLAALDTFVKTNVTKGVTESQRLNSRVTDVETAMNHYLAHRDAGTLDTLAHSGPINTALANLHDTAHRLHVDIESFYNNHSYHTL